MTQISGHLNSDNIEIQAAEWNLMLPLFVDEVDVLRTPYYRHRLDRWVDRIERSQKISGSSFDGKWILKTDEYPKAITDGHDFLPEYAEYVYFHTFVRNFLYIGRQDEFDAAAMEKATVQNQSIRTMERQHLEGAKLFVEFNHGYGDGRQRLRVCTRIRKCQLYLFDTGIAIFALKISLTGDDTSKDDYTLLPVQIFDEDAKQFSDRQRMNLKQLLKFQDIVRRLYPPYFDRERNPQRCPESIWIEEKNAAVEQHEMHGRGLTDARSLNHQIVANREAPSLPFWRELLLPLEPNQIERYGSSGRVKRPQDFNDVPGSNSGLRFLQLFDDRIPLMSYVAVKDVWQIKPGDWARLALIDDDGDSDLMPYSPSFRNYEEICKRYFYDRFYTDQPHSKGANASMCGVRWHCSGYGFGAVVSSFYNQSDFNVSKSDGPRAHLRHHYFKMGLVAYFHHASLLNFKREIAEAVRWLRRDGDDRSERVDFRLFRERITDIERSFLRFRSQYWSPEVSNHLQGKELYERWSKHLGIETLFDTINDELHAASEVLERHHQVRQAKWTKRLTLVGALFIVAGPIITELAEKSIEKVAYLFVAGVLVFFTCWLAVSLLDDFPYGRKQRELLARRQFFKRVRFPFFRNLALLLVSLVGLFVASWYYLSKSNDDSSKDSIRTDSGVRQIENPKIDDSDL